jgi:hypothetical protein
LKNGKLTMSVARLSLSPSFVAERDPKRYHLHYTMH